MLLAKVLYTLYNVFITHAVIVKEQGEFGWMMSTAIVTMFNCQIAVIVDGASITVATVKMLLCNVPVSIFLQLPVSY